MTQPLLNDIALPGSTTRWVDEHDWSPVGQSAENDIFGGMVVEYAAGPADGRPLTISLGWINKTALDALKALRDAADQALMTLVLPDGRSFDVLWRHHEKRVIEAVPVNDFTEHAATDYFDVTLKLMEVAQW